MRHITFSLRKREGREGETESEKTKINIKISGSKTKKQWLSYAHLDARTQSTVTSFRLRKTKQTNESFGAMQVCNFYDFILLSSDRLVTIIAIYLSLGSHWLFLLNFCIGIYHEYHHSHCLYSSPSLLHIFSSLYMYCVI